MSHTIYVVGIGPGFKEYSCPKASKTLENSDIVVGYKAYIDLVEPYIKGPRFIRSSMMKEVDRCKEVLSLAEAGNTVSLISSGDAGIYGMAGIMIEVAASSALSIPVEIVPGISASVSAASLLGAPLMNDYVTLSLSDLLTPWEIITRRLEAACLGDFVIALYNPRSKKRIKQLEEARAIMLKHKQPDTVVGIVKHAMREQQEVILTNLNDMLQYDIDMFTTIIIGNTQTENINGKMVTRRGYRI